MLKYFSSFLFLRVNIFISSEIDRSVLPEHFLEYHYAFYSDYKYARHASRSTKNKIKISNRESRSKAFKGRGCDLEAALE